MSIFRSLQKSFIKIFQTTFSPLRNNNAHSKLRADVYFFLSYYSSPAATAHVRLNPTQTNNNLNILLNAVTWRRVLSKTKQTPYRRKECKKREKKSTFAKTKPNFAHTLAIFQASLNLRWHYFFFVFSVLFYIWTNAIVRDEKKCTKNVCLDIVFANFAVYIYVREKVQKEIYYFLNIFI